MAKKTPLILETAFRRGGSKPYSLDKDYLLAEMQKIADDLSSVVSGYSLLDQPLILNVLDSAANSLRASLRPEQVELAELLNELFGSELISVQVEGGSHHGSESC